MKHCISCLIHYFKHTWKEWNVWIRSERTFHLLLLLISLDKIDPLYLSDLKTVQYFIALDQYFPFFTRIRAAVFPAQKILLAYHISQKTIVTAVFVPMDFKETTAKQVTHPKGYINLHSGCFNKRKIIAGMCATIESSCEDRAWKNRALERKEKGFSETVPHARCHDFEYFMMSFIMDKSTENGKDWKRKKVSYLFDLRPQQKACIFATDAHVNFFY